MGLNLKDSVCDTNLNYHGIDNLIINNSSVFPSGGITKPYFDYVSVNIKTGGKIK